MKNLFPQLKRTIPFAVLLPIVLVYAYSFSVKHILLGEWSACTFEKLVAGSAPLPFQYRILVPWVAGELLQVIGLLPFVDHLNGIRFLIEFTAVATLLSSVFLCARTIPVVQPVAGAFDWVFRGWTAMFITMLALPFHFFVFTPRPAQVFYPYDIPTAVFFVLSLACILTKRRLLFYGVFVFATFNRETSFFLTVAFLLAEWREMSVKRLLAHIAAQICLWTAIKGLLFFLYYGSDTATSCGVFRLFNNSIPYNLDRLSEPSTYATLASLYGYLWIPLLFMVKDISCPRLKRMMWTIPLFHIAMFVPGEILELRIYIEMLPFVVWGLLAGIQGRLVPLEHTKIANCACSTQPSSSSSTRCP